MRVTLLIYMLISLSLASASEWSAEIERFLPQSVQSIEPGKTGQGKIHQEFGPPDFKKNGKEYWALNDFKYALEISYEDYKVKSYHYTFQKGPLVEEVASLKGENFENDPAIPNGKKLKSGNRTVSYSLTSGRVTGYREEM